MPFHILYNIKYKISPFTVLPRYLPPIANFYYFACEIFSTFLSDEFLALKLIPQTEEIRVNTVVSQGLKLNGEDIKRSSYFCYLGSTVTENGGTSREVNVRIRKARGSFSKLRKVCLLLHRASCRLNNYHKTNNCTNCM